MFWLNKSMISVLVLNGLLLLYPTMLSQFFWTPQTGTEQKIRAQVKRLVCNTFSVVSFSASKDTAETIGKIRRHNAKYLSFGCAAGKGK